MFKIKVRPHQDNRYLYNITIYERSKWFIFSFWKRWNYNEGFPDWGVSDYINGFRRDHKVIALDMLYNQELELKK